MLTTPTQPSGTVFWWVPSVLEREREFRKVGVNLQVGYRPTRFRTLGLISTY